MKKSNSKSNAKICQITSLILLVGIIVTAVLGALRFQAAGDELARLEKGCNLTYNSEEEVGVVDLELETRTCFLSAAPSAVAREQAAYVEGCMLFCTAAILLGLLIKK